MTAKDFHLITEWRLDAPVEAVWQVLTEVEDWPNWWPAVIGVEVIEPGDDTGVGSLRRMTWRTALPYALSFDMRTTRVMPKTLIEGQTSGELDGIGRWTLAEYEGGTHVRYDWIVAVSKPWMRWLAPVLRPVFAWNHEEVMDWGLAGIKRKLQASGR